MEYLKTFKVKYENKDKNNKSMSFSIDNENYQKNIKTIWSKIEGLKNIELNTLPIYDDRYIRTKIRTYGNNVYGKFCALNVPVECESFTVISIDSLLVYENKYYLQVRKLCL